MSRGADVVVESRFNGPPGMGNGGYVCGRMGAFVDGPAQVRLHVPVPLDRPLRVEREKGQARLYDGGLLVATAAPHPFTLDVPPAPSPDRAREASRAYAGFDGHPFSTCFVCGTARKEGDGLRLFAGPLEEKKVAAPFAPPANLLDEGGMLRPEFVWAALDCPGFFAGLGRNLVPMLLGEFAVERRAPVPGREPLVVFAWVISEEGRKIRAGSALAGADGNVLAVGRAVWIKPRDAK